MKNANVVALLACCATVLSFAIAPAARPAGDLRRGSTQIDRKSAASVARVRDYRPILQEWRDATGAVKLAIRRMSISYSILLLLVDPATLETSVESAAGWSCSETSDEAQSEPRYMRALRAKSEGRNWSETERCKTWDWAEAPAAASFLPATSVRAGARSIAPFSTS